LGEGAVRGQEKREGENKKKRAQQYILGEGAVGGQEKREGKNKKKRAQ